MVVSRLHIGGGGRVTMAWRQWLKGPLRPVVRPLIERVGARTAEAVEPRLTALERGLSGLRDDVGELTSALSKLVGGVATSADGTYREPFDELARRIEFVRKEVLFELRYGHRDGSTTSELEPRILNSAKLEAMQGSIRLNLGAGHVSRPEYLNVDARELDGIDVMADVGHLPFEKSSVAEIYSAHVLEHFPIEELRNVLLPYWVSLLVPGGQFVAVVPDLETMTREFAAGRLDFEELREVTYGTQEYEGDFHFNGFSQESLRSLLEGCGLSDVQYPAWARRNGMCYEMEVVAVRPDGAPPG
jgi:hypothetical protein